MRNYLSVFLPMLIGYLFGVAWTIFIYEVWK